MGVCGIAPYQEILKVIPKAELGSHSHCNMKQGEIFGVTEPTLDGASVTLYLLKNGTTPIMTCWLPCASFSVDTVLSAQHHQVCNKTNTKLSRHSYLMVISLQGPRENPVFEYHHSPSLIYESLPGFRFCKRYCHNALVLTGALIRTLL